MHTRRQRLRWHRIFSVQRSRLIHISCAMLLVSAFTGIMLLLLYGGYSAAVSVLCALTMAAAGTIVELFSPSEWDTVTVPVAMLAIALIML